MAEIKPSQLTYDVTPYQTDRLSLVGNHTVNVEPRLSDGKAYCHFTDPVLSKGASRWEGTTWGQEIVLTVDTPLNGQHGEKHWRCAVTLVVRAADGSTFRLPFPEAPVPGDGRTSKWSVVEPGDRVDALFTALSKAKTPLSASLELASSTSTSP